MGLVLHVEVSFRRLDKHFDNTFAEKLPSQRPLPRISTCDLRDAIDSATTRIRLGDALRETLDAKTQLVADFDAMRPIEASRIWSNIVPSNTTFRVLASARRSSTRGSLPHSWR